MPKFPVPAKKQPPALSRPTATPVSTHSLRLTWPDGFTVDLLPVNLTSNRSVAEMRDLVLQRFTDGA